MNKTLLKYELRRDEDVRLKAYLCSAGKWTNGVGHTRGVFEGQTITAEQAEAWLEQDIADAVSDLDRALPWWRRLSDARQRALVNMAFNIGLPRLLGFRQMLAALEAGDYDRAAFEALDSRWARQVGGRARRIAEMIREG